MKKATAIVVIIVVGLFLAVAPKADDQASATPGDCYSSGSGPAEPTICT